MADPTWDNRERLILEAVVAAQERGEDVSPAARAAVPTLSEQLYGEVLDSLASDGYLDVAIARGGAGKIFGARVRRPLPRARRAVGQWPSEDAFENLVAVLEERIEREPDENRRTKLERFRDDLYGLGKGAAGSLIAEFLKRMAGM